MLLINFMVITPLAPRGLNVLAPQPAPAGRETGATERHFVITVEHGGAVRLNREALPFAAQPGRLHDLYKNGATNVVFIRGAKGLEFRDVAGVIDAASAWRS